MKFSGHKPKTETFMGRLDQFLAAKWLQVLMVTLLIIDMILVIVSLELQIMSQNALIQEYKRCYGQYNNVFAVPPGLNNGLNNPVNLPVCVPDTHKAHNYHHVEQILAWFSVSILVVFLVENLLHIILLGLDYFQDFFYVLDLTVVTLSLILELVFLIDLIPGATVGGLLVIARTWRFARIAHGFYFLEHEDEHSHSRHGGPDAKKADDPKEGGLKV